MPTPPISHAQFRENRSGTTVEAQLTAFETAWTNLTVAAPAPFDPYRLFNNDDAAANAVARYLPVPVGATYVLVHQLLPPGVTAVNATTLRAAGLLPAYSGASQNMGDAGNTSRSWRQFNTNQPAAQLDAHGIWTPLGNLNTQEYEITLPTNILMRYHTTGMSITQPVMVHTLGCTQLLLAVTTAAVYTGTPTGNGLLVATFGK